MMKHLMILLVAFLPLCTWAQAQKIAVVDVMSIYNACPEKDSAEPCGAAVSIPAAPESVPGVWGHPSPSYLPSSRDIQALSPRFSPGRSAAGSGAGERGLSSGGTAGFGCFRGFSGLCSAQVPL